MDCATLNYLFEVQYRKEEQKTDNSPMWTTYPSDNQQNLRPNTMKSQRRGREVPNTKIRGVTQIREDPLDRLPMQCPLRRLKMSTKTHTELYIRPHHRQVQ
jgi:hypothetical protein